MNIKMFTVAPSVPERISFLETLARNVWWCWHLDAIELFRRINPQVWKDLGHNPLRFLSSIPQKQLEALAQDESFLRHMEQVQAHYREEGTPRDGASGDCLAYFSLEFGLHESLRLYSGGLGVLAGDHLKAASDLNLPLVGVGLMYRLGYFRQGINNDGWQVEHYPENEVHHQPLQRVRDASGNQLQISIPLPEGRLNAIVWRIDVGRVPLILLDSNIPENPPEFRAVTDQLYGGDKKIRLRQELLLGIGGFRALVAMGFDPAVCHLNEGHAAFSSLARLEYLVQRKKLDLETALQVVRHTSVFTTHTPVPAGNEYFAHDLLRPHLNALAPETGVTTETVLEAGNPPGHSGSHELAMTILGLRMAHYANGVSRLHGAVARKMWSTLWPEYQEDEIPIGHITNGIHASSWVSPDLAMLFDRYLGPQWRNHPVAMGSLGNIAHVPDEELWRARELGRSRLVRTVRELMERGFKARNAPVTEIAQIKSALDHDTLTIGFARRFATYKRATLLLRDPDRFEALLTNSSRPVQFIFAGKAHPADDQGKRFIQELVRFARRPSVRRHIVFLENYNIYAARALVQGVDVWLNNPRRPQEASGTSGMKAAANGGLNLSILDGWWCEGHTHETGWAIGNGEEYEDTEFGDRVEAQALFNLLENEVLPLFYDRPAGELPTAWIRMMKAAIAMGLGQFSSHRMVSEYNERFYKPARDDYHRLLADDAAAARTLVAQHRRLTELWKHVRIEPPVPEVDVSLMHIGDTLRVHAKVHLGELRPDDVDVQVYFGPVDTHNRITESHTENMRMERHVKDGHFIFAHEIICRRTGRYGFTARVLPKGAHWRHAIPGFIAWA